MSLFAERVRVRQPVPVSRVNMNLELQLEAIDALACTTITTTSHLKLYSTVNDGNLIVSCFSVIQYCVC